MNEITITTAPPPHTHTQTSSFSAFRSRQLSCVFITGGSNDWIIYSISNLIQRLSLVVMGCLCKTEKCSMQSLSICSGQFQLFLLSHAHGLCTKYGTPHTHTSQTIRNKFDFKIQHEKSHFFFFFFATLLSLSPTTTTAANTIFVVTAHPEIAIFTGARRSCGE